MMKHYVEKMCSFNLLIAPSLKHEEEMCKIKTDI
jgi:hypothetical protein